VAVDQVLALWQKSHALPRGSEHCHKPPAGVKTARHLLASYLPGTEHGLTSSPCAGFPPLSQHCQNEQISSVGEINSISNGHSTGGKACTFDSHLRNSSNAYICSRLHTESSSRRQPFRAGLICWVTPHGEGTDFLPVTGHHKCSATRTLPWPALRLHDPIQVLWVLGSKC